MGTRIIDRPGLTLFLGKCEYIRHDLFRTLAFLLLAGACSGLKKNATAITKLKTLVSLVPQKTEREPVVLKYPPTRLLAFVTNN